MRHESRKGGEEGQGARHTPKEPGVVNRCGGVGGTWEHHSWGGREQTTGSRSVMVCALKQKGRCEVFSVLTCLPGLLIRLSFLPVTGAPSVCTPEVTRWGSGASLCA